MKVNSTGVIYAEHKSKRKARWLRLKYPLHRAERYGKMKGKKRGNK
jgi:hypothetical protein